MGKKSPSWPLKGSPPGPIIGILMPGGPRGPGYRGPMGGKPGPPGPTFEETVFYADNEIGNFTMRGGPGVPGD